MSRAQIRISGRGYTWLVRIVRKCVRGVRGGRGRATKDGATRRPVCPEI